MRAAPTLFVLSLLLSGCLPTLERAADPSPEITVTVLADAPGEADDAPAPAQADDAEPPEPAPPAAEPHAPAADLPRLPPALAAEQRACAARGGVLRPRGTGGLWACIRVTRDAGRPCATGADCEGSCLARSRTCTPFEPLFGCHDVLDRAGRLQTLCRE
jgi:hypothetical protein